MKKYFQCALLLFLPLVSSELKAQTASKVEVGVQFTSLTFPPFDYNYAYTESGFGGRLTYNINDNIAVEGEANFFPNKNVFGYLGENRAVQAQFGLKAGKRFRKLGVFAKARPGFLTVGDVFSYRPGSSVTRYGLTLPNTRIGRETHFTTDLGGVLEFYPSHRTMVRFDAGDTIVRFGPHYEPDPVSFTQLIKRPANIKHSIQITAGVGFRFAGPASSRQDTASTSAKEDVPRFELGVHFTSMARNLPKFACSEICFLPTDPGPENEPGLGGRFTYNVHRNVGLEAELNYLPRTASGTPWGHIYQGQFGVKAGKRFRTFGLFGKFRPGFVGFTQTSQLVGTHMIEFAGRQLIAGDFRFGRNEYFSLDTGAVIELYVSRRLMTRMDFGDTVIKYGEYAVSGFSTADLIIRRPPETRHNFQFNAGVGFRF